MIKRANILTNSFWYGFEMAAELCIGVTTSIAVARVLGPEILGPYFYLSFLTKIAGRLGGLGIADAARRYISEYLASGQPGLARLIFFTTLRIQMVLALLLPAGGILLAWWAGDPKHFWVAALLVASLGPLLLSSITAHTNIAAENFARNVPGAMAGLFLYATIIVLTLTLKWGLLGLAVAIFARRALETAIRLTQALAWMLRLPKVPRPEGLQRKLLTFSGQAGLVTLLTLVVWDRSEIIFLKHFCDIRQLAYYSIAFSLTEYLMLLPTALGGAVSAALMAEFSRGGNAGASKLVNASIQHLSLVILPAHMGIAALSASLVPALYGAAYLPAIPALAIAAILSVPKAFYWLPIAVCRSMERQGIILRWLLVSGLLNVGLDLLLIPGMGATGAALANGIAQGCVVFAMWRSVTHIYPFDIPWPVIMRIGAAAATMGAAVFAFTRLTPPLFGLLGGVPLGAAVYLAVLRFTRAIGAAQAEALADALRRLPRPAHRLAFPVLGLITSPDITPGNRRPVTSAVRASVEVEKQ